MDCIPLKDLRIEPMTNDYNTYQLQKMVKRALEFADKGNYPTCYNVIDFNCENFCFSCLRGKVKRRIVGQAVAWVDVIGGIQCRFTGKREINLDEINNLAIMMCAKKSGDFNNRDEHKHDKTNTHKKSKRKYVDN